MREELSAENRALIYRLFGPSSGKLIAEATLPMLPASINAILDAARSEGHAKHPQGDVGEDSGLAAADDNHKALVEAAQLTLDEATEYGYGTADVHLILHHDAYHALERAVAPFTKETDHGED